jgi:hypothetical protein
VKLNHSELEPELEQFLLAQVSEPALAQVYLSEQGLVNPLEYLLEQLLDQVSVRRFQLELDRLVLIRLPSCAQIERSIRARQSQLRPFELEVRDRYP